MMSICKRTLCMAHVAVKSVGCWCPWAVCRGARSQGVIAHGTRPTPRDGASISLLSNHLSIALKVPRSSRWRRAEVPPGVALGPPSGVHSLQPCGTRCEIQAAHPAAGNGSQTRAESELILSLVLHASSEYSCFSGLENPGFPSPYLGNS